MLQQSILSMRSDSFERVRGEFGITEYEGMP